MKKILVALTLCMVSIMGFRANPTTNTVEALPDSIETSIETLQDSIKPIPNTTSDRRTYTFMQDGIVIIVKDGVYYDVLGRVIRYYGVTNRMNVKKDYEPSVLK